jgi:hypothetical protein
MIATRPSRLPMQLTRPFRDIQMPDIRTLFWNYH